MNSLTFTMALLMGFTGSLHCAGMCGPIVWVMPFQQYKGFSKALALGLYHFGRISVYAIMAVVLHSFRAVFAPQVQQYISVILGAGLLAAGIAAFIPRKRVNVKLPWAGYVKDQLGKVIGRPGLGTLTMAGALNGLLPCGLVYMALSATLTVPSSLQAAGVMYAFGTGTLPMLISISVLRAKLSFLRTNNIRRLVPVVVFAFGCFFILRGMNLGIPYLSPRVAIVGHEIKSCCCHKN